MSTHKKTKKTIKKTNKKLNIYSTNFRYIDNDKDRKYLSKLTNFLADNEWLKASHEKYQDFTIDKKIFNDRNIKKYLNTSKPMEESVPLSWFSKGSWLFYPDFCCNIDTEIIYIAVDYKNIYKITNKSPYSDLSSNDDYKSQLLKFNKKYSVKNNIFKKNSLVHKKDASFKCNLITSEKMCGYKKTKKNNNNNENKLDEDENNCKWDKKTNKCKFRHCSKKTDDCVSLPYLEMYNWSKFLKDYDGLAIYPMMSVKEMKQIQNHYGFAGWDVESLFLSTSEPIIKHHNLGTIGELLNITTKDVSNFKINYSKLVSKLIEKINEVRKL